MSSLDIPKRMFAIGEEPVGVRVTSYHKGRGIQLVLDAFDEAEIAYLRNSSFGQIIALVDKATFSGRFCRFILSRQLKINKKHEIWILFAGRPIRFSLWEFAIVTGLPCGQLPPKKSKTKLKNQIKEKSNWDNLFGTLSSISVESVLSMLKNHIVTDWDIRMKYACLALLDSVLLPTTHQHKIDRAHVELIRDLNEFFSYPWGWVAFDLIMSSIKERDEVSLSQNTLAVKGFVYALQLVMVQAVDEEGEGDDVDEDENDKQEGKVVFSPGHARNSHDSPEVVVNSIIPVPEGLHLDLESLEWKDELIDVRVDNLVNLVKANHVFYQEIFVGGATKEDIIRMQNEAKEKKEKEKTAKAKVEPSVNQCGGVLLSKIEFEKFTDLVAAKVIDDINDRIEDTMVKVSELNEFVKNIKLEWTTEWNGRLKEMVSTLTGVFTDMIRKSVWDGEFNGKERRLRSWSAKNW